MSYYPTLAEDLARAKEILEKGKSVFCTRHCSTPTRDPEQEHPGICTCGGFLTDGGTIIGADTYAAYKLLESFVEEIERLQREAAPVKRLFRYLDPETGEPLPESPDD